MAKSNYDVKLRISAQDDATRKTRVIFSAVAGQAKSAAAGVGKVFSAVTSLKSALVGLSAGYIGVKGVQELINWGNNADELAKFAKQAGFSAESLDAWNYVAEMSGVSAADFGRSISLLNKQVGEFDTGSALGVFLDKVAPNLKKALAQAESTEEAAVIGIDALRKLNGDTARQTALATKLFGRSGMTMIRLAKAEKSALEELLEEKRAYGTVSNESAANGEEFQDSLTRVSTAVQGLKNAIGGALIPVITPAANKMSEFIRAYRPLLEQKAGEWAVTLGKGLDWLVSDGFPKLLDKINELFEKTDRLLTLAKAFAAIWVTTKTVKGILGVTEAILGMQKALSLASGTAAALNGASGLGSIASMAAGGSAIAAGGLVAAIVAATVGITALVVILEQHNQLLRKQWRDRELKKREERAKELETKSTKRLDLLPESERAEVLELAKDRLRPTMVRDRQTGKMRAAKPEESPEYWKKVEEIATRRVHIRERETLDRSVRGYEAPGGSFSAGAPVAGGILDINVNIAGAAPGTDVDLTPSFDFGTIITPRIKTVTRRAGQ